VVFDMILCGLDRNVETAKENQNTQTQIKRNDVVSSVVSEIKAMDR